MTRPPTARKRVGMHWIGVSFIIYLTIYPFIHDWVITWRQAYDVVALFILIEQDFGLAHLDKVFKHNYAH